MSILFVCEVEPGGYAVTDGKGSWGLTKNGAVWITTDLENPLLREVDGIPFSGKTHLDLTVFKIVEIRIEKHTREVLNNA